MNRGHDLCGPSRTVTPTPPPGAPNLFNGSTIHGFLGQRRVRHPSEIPLLVIGILVTVVAYLVFLGVTLTAPGRRPADQRPL